MFWRDLLYVLTGLNVCFDGSYCMFWRDLMYVLTGLTVCFDGTYCMFWRDLLMFWRDLLYVLTRLTVFWRDLLYVLTGLTVCFQRKNSAEMKKTYTRLQGQSFSLMSQIMFSSLSWFSWFFYIDDLKINHKRFQPTQHKILLTYSVLICICSWFQSRYFVISHERTVRSSCGMIWDSVSVFAWNDRIKPPKHSEHPSAA
jgi:hypothetical protein